jgi:hypothetical protein
LSRRREEAAAEQTLAALSENLEGTIAFAEQCRWHFSDLEQDADALNAHAWALFGKAARSLGSRDLT